MWAKLLIRLELIPVYGSIKRLGVFLFPPGWDASQGYPPALNWPVPIDTPGWREALWELLSDLTKNITQCPRPGLEPVPLASELNALTKRPPRLPLSKRIPETTETGFFFTTLTAINNTFCHKEHLTFDWQFRKNGIKARRSTERN